MTCFKILFHISNAVGAHVRWKCVNQSCRGMQAYNTLPLQCSKVDFFWWIFPFYLPKVRNSYELLYDFQNYLLYGVASTPVPQYQ